MVVAFALHAICKPIKLARGTNNLPTKNKKPSIADSRESFMIHITIGNKREEAIEELKTKMAKKQLKLQPVILVQGITIEQVDQFFVVYDNVSYKFDSFLKCVDICFKICQIFNFEYPKDSIVVWTFIQQYFYQISLDSDIKHHNITSLINYLESS